MKKGHALTFRGSQRFCGDECKKAFTFKSPSISFRTIWTILHQALQNTLTGFE
jgi:hypothetical protein